MDDPKINKKSNKKHKTYDIPNPSLQMTSNIRFATWQPPLTGNT
jgi:hypothetical protein